MPARPVTASYLRKSALHYLAGRAASAAMVRQTLERRALRRLGVRRLEAETLALIDAAIANLTQLGLIDDATFAHGRAGSLQRKGWSRQRIGLGLRQKGLSGETIEQAIPDDVDDLAQARLFAQRKRLGPWRPAANATTMGPAADAAKTDTAANAANTDTGRTTALSHDKDLRALARAGFSWAIAQQALREPQD